MTTIEDLRLTNPQREELLRYFTSGDDLLRFVKPQVAEALGRKGLAWHISKDDIGMKVRLSDLGQEVAKTLYQAQHGPLMPLMKSKAGDYVRTGVRRLHRRRGTGHSLVDHIVKVDHLYGASMNARHVIPICGGASGRASFSETDELCKVCAKKWERMQEVQT